jgi:predicted transcriptional regulator
MKPRHNLYLDEDVGEQLEALTAMAGSSKSSIVNDAVRAYLARRGAKELDDAFKVRLDRVSEQLRRLERDQSVMIESFALFVRYHLGIPPREQVPWAIDRIVQKVEPCRPQLALVAQLPGRPLCRDPHPADCNGEHDRDLTDKEFGGCHALPPDESGVARNPKNENRLYVRRSSPA